MHAFGAYHPNYTRINSSTSKPDVNLNPLYVMMYQWYVMVQPKPNLMHFLQNTDTQVYTIYTSASDITHKLLTMVYMYHKHSGRLLAELAFPQPREDIKHMDAAAGKPISVCCNTDLWHSSSSPALRATDQTTVYKRSWHACLESCWILTQNRISYNLHSMCTCSCICACM